MLGRLSSFVGGASSYVGGVPPIFLGAGGGPALCFLWLCCRFRGAVAC